MEHGAIDDHKKGLAGRVQKSTAKGSKRQPEAPVTASCQEEHAARQESNVEGLGFEGLGLDCQMASFST